MADTTLPAYPTVADLVASAQSAVNALNSLITNFNDGGVTETYIEANAFLLGSDADSYDGVTEPGAYELLGVVRQACFILTASGNDLDLKAADVGVTRKPATYSTGFVVFTATTPPTADLVIPQGTLVAANPADPTQQPTVFGTTAAVTIPAGSQTSPPVLVEAVNAGASGNQIPGAVNISVNAPSGLTVTNPNAIAGGQNTEGDDTPNGGLRARALAAIPNASQCTISAIELAARSFPGVTDAVLLENTADDQVTFLLGRGQLYLDDGTGDLGNTANPNNAVLATVQAAFDSGLYRAAGTQVHVVGSRLVLVTISLTVYVNAQYAASQNSAANVALLVQQAVYNYVATVGIGKPVVIAEIIRVAAEIEGVSNVPATAVFINGANIDFQPANVQTPRASSIESITVNTSLVGY